MQDLTSHKCILNGKIEHFLSSPNYNNKDPLNTSSSFIQQQNLFQLTNAWPKILLSIDFIALLYLTFIVKTYCSVQSFLSYILLSTKVIFDITFDIGLHNILCSRLSTCIITVRQLTVAFFLIPNNKEWLLFVIKKYLEECGSLIFVMVRLNSICLLT